MYKSKTYCLKNLVIMYEEFEDTKGIIMYILLHSLLQISSIKIALIIIIKSEYIFSY